MSHEIFDRKVDGMICPQCEDEIAHRLLHTRGILSCTASYRKSTVTADFDPTSSPRTTSGASSPGPATPSATAAAGGAPMRSRSCSLRACILPSPP